MYLASGLPNTAPGKDPKEKRSMAPTTPVSAPLAGGSKNALAPCVATKYPRMRCVSVACSPGVATFLRQRTEPICQDSKSQAKATRDPHGLFPPDLPIPTIERSQFHRSIGNRRIVW